MSNLYLIDQPFGGNGLALAQHDDEAIIVLIQDGVNLDTSNLGNGAKPVYAVKKDLERRGLNGLAARRIKPIDFGELVDLVVAHKVVNFA